MTWINPAETRREYKRTQEQHQPPRTTCRGKTCRKCGAIIIDGENGAALFETCTTCRGGAPIYPKPSSHARTIYDAEEEDAAEARARSINFDYD